MCTVSLQVGDVRHLQKGFHFHSRTNSKSNLLICFIQGSDTLKLIDWLKSHPDIRPRSTLPNKIEDSGDFIVHPNNQIENKTPNSNDNDAV